MGSEMCIRDRYLYRALALQQSDPLLCLLCGVASLGRSTNRQVDNRNHTIIQGMALFTHYAELRGDIPEVDYNFARAYHHLNLVHLAVPRYERVLERASSKASKGTFDMAREAAFNLAMIFTQSGSPDLARHLYRTWLAVE